MECKATTNAGTQCSRTAKSNSSYCWQHQNYENGEIKEINLSESDKILSLERDRLQYFGIKESKISLSSDIKFKVPEIENIIQNYQISDLLDYKVVNYILTLFQKIVEYDFSKFEYPFQFSANLFYGAHTQNKKEFYKYLFVDSFWQYIKDNTKVSNDSIFSVFGTSKASFENVKYEGICTDPYIFIRSNIPIVYPSPDHTYFPTLFNTMDISLPTPDVEYWLRTGKYTYGYDNTMLDYFNQKYKFADANLKTPEEIYPRYLKLFFQYSADPGFNTQILKNKKNPTLKEFEMMKKEIPIFNNSDEVRTWTSTNKLWRQKNIGIDIFTLHELSRYQNYSSTRINSNCREDTYIDKDNNIIIKSFNFCVPLETNIVVHRVIDNYGNVLSKLRIYKGEENIDPYIITETALMSTSINYEHYRAENISGGIKIVFSLYVTIGSCCIPTYVTGSENELIFPPGTKYILYDRKIYKKKIVHYTGVIIT